MPRRSFLPPEEKDESEGVVRSLQPGVEGEQTRLKSGLAKGTVSTANAEDGARPTDVPIDHRKWSKTDGVKRKSSDEMISLAQGARIQAMRGLRSSGRLRIQNPWRCSRLSLLVTLLSALFVLVTVRSFLSRQVDPKGCRMSYMRPGFAKFADFDTEHTRFASKYELYLYREGGIDEDTRVKGVPVLFIPGNAGSYKQVRPLAAEAAQYFHDVVQHEAAARKDGKLSLDFFTVNFNEDISAFHGQTLLDQAEYLNEAVAFILSLYHDPRRSIRDPDLPDPSQVILIGHSMGGIVARAMLVMPNYQANTINTIVTMSAPHARPPVSFDGEIVRTYQKINNYWRDAYAQRWANNNPLWHVTLISVAGGGLDTVIPSDYASLASLVPDTHGFTVFASSIPNVWTGMDHQAILWCDQLRKVIIRSLMELIDARRPGQTRPRADRMRVFKKWLLTGLEDVVEKALPQMEPTILLTLEDNSNAIISQGERFALRSFGASQKAKAHLLPVPVQAAAGQKSFSLLTDQALTATGTNENLDVLFCSVFPLQLGQSASLFSMNMDLSGNSSGSTRLACKNAAVDVTHLPASTRTSHHPFDDVTPFSYLQYHVEDVAEHQFVAIVDKAAHPTAGWAVAEFSSTAQSQIQSGLGFWPLLLSGFRMTLAADRPMVTQIKLPAVHSSLLAYRLTIGRHGCGDGSELFTSFVRQYISDPYESKFFVNVKQANINLHGIAPFMPPPMRQASGTEGVSLQVWSDPACHSTMDVALDLDILGSIGKLFMRYRTLFAAFPLLVAALVLRKQFAIYDATGVFVSFGEALDRCLRQSLPLVFLALSICAVGLARRAGSSSRSHRFLDGVSRWRGNATESPRRDYRQNDLLLGSPDPFFWFLVPVLGATSVGLCLLLHLLVTGLTYVCLAAYGIVVTRPGWVRHDDDPRGSSSSFAANSARRRLATISVLLVLVSTIIPYQFAFLVACLVQAATCARALKVAHETRSAQHFSLYHYAHAILILMIWLLPINIFVLLVWVHNLAVHWLTPFSSHHNVFSIMPVLLLVETIACGNMIPRITTPYVLLVLRWSASGRVALRAPRADPGLCSASLRSVTQLLLIVFGGYAAVYGVSYAYTLHHLFNLVLAVWFLALHSSATGALYSLAARLSLFLGLAPAPAPDSASALASADGERERERERDRDRDRDPDHLLHHLHPPADHRYPQLQHLHDPDHHHDDNDDNDDDDGHDGHGGRALDLGQGKKRP
ncbi:MAG: GPI inositol deacylase [Phylliscum demangeonii]|nr:MAG: GPI inositol deacylase [Phylliscum demangeonii]